MLSARWRPVLICGVAVIAVWILALTGFTIAKTSKMTAERVRAYVESVDLGKISKSRRAAAIQKLANKLNALPVEERRRAQLARVTKDWFDQMTEEEKAQFVEATIPPGFKQMLASFEQLPEEKRRRTIEDTLRRLRESVIKIRASEGKPGGTNGLPTLNTELVGKIRNMGLVDFYSQSSPQTKSDLAPVLEELQRVMETGRPFRGR